MNEDRKKDHQNMAGSTEHRKKGMKTGSTGHTGMKTGRKTNQNMAGRQSLTHRNEDRKKDQTKHGRMTEFDTQSEDRNILPTDSTERQK